MLQSLQKTAQGDSTLVAEHIAHPPWNFVDQLELKSQKSPSTLPVVTLAHCLRKLLHTVHFVGWLVEVGLVTSETLWVLPRQVSVTTATTASSFRFPETPCENQDTNM